MREVKSSENKRLLSFIHKNQQLINNIIKKKEEIKELKDEINKTKEKQKDFIIFLYIASGAAITLTIISFGLWPEIFNQENDVDYPFSFLLAIEILACYLPISIFIKFVVKKIVNKFIFEKKLQKLNNELNSYKKKIKTLEENLFSLLNKSHINKNFFDFILKSNNFLNLLNNEYTLYKKEKKFFKSKT